MKSIVLLLSLPLLVLPHAASAALIRGPYLQAVSPTAITIRWRTDTATNSRIAVGPAPGAWLQFASASGVTTEHEVRVQGLIAGRTYYYTVGSSTTFLPGVDATWRFATPPSAGAAVPTRIWVLGDPGNPTGGQKRVRDAYLAWTGTRATDVWITLGDNAYESGTDSEYQAGLFDPYRVFMRGHCLWPTRGNHDDLHTGVANDYYELFTLPAAAEAGGVASSTEAWYSFDHGDVHFVCLDSEGSSRDPGSPMLTWLAADLAATSRTWVIAYWHHPPYSKGSHDSDTDTRMTDMRENVMPILEAYGVDVVLGGHSHGYERSYLVDGHYGASTTLRTSMILDDGDGSPEGDGAYHKPPGSPGAHQGLVAVVAGGSSSLESGPFDHPVMVRSMSALGSVVIDVAGGMLEGVYLDDAAQVRDHFAIRKASVIDSGGAGVFALRLSSTNPVRRGPVEFRITVPAAGTGTLSIVNVSGRRIRELPVTAGEGGVQVARWDGGDETGRVVTAGVYFVTLEFAGERRSGRVVFIP